MAIYNDAALKEAFKLLNLDISMCRHVIASPAAPGLKIYYQNRLNTLENIQGWLKVHS